jgi:hypothetical protein
MLLRMLCDHTSGQPLNDKCMCGRDFKSARKVLLRSMNGYKAARSVAARYAASSPRMPGNSILS